MKKITYFCDKCGSESSEEDLVNVSYISRDYKEVCISCFIFTENLKNTERKDRDWLNMTCEYFYSLPKKEQYFAPIPNSSLMM